MTFKHCAWATCDYKSGPSPLPSHDDGNHTALVAAGEKTLVGDGLGPEYSQNSSKILGAVEVGKSVKVSFSHSPAF